MLYRNQKVLLVGLGLQGGGVATVKWLIKQGAKVTVTDLKTSRQLNNSLIKLNRYPVKYLLGTNSVPSLKQFDLLIQNPAVPRDHPLIIKAKKLGLPIENEASLFFKNCPAPLIGITGSKGKSTATSLLGHIFKQYNSHSVVAGNIRDQIMLDVLPKIKVHTPVILELSSWHLEGLGRWRLSPSVSVVLNILSDHLDRYLNLKDYARAKANIWLWQHKQDKVILNYDNKWTRKMGQLAKSQVYWFSNRHQVERGSYLDHKTIYYCEGNKKEKVLPSTQIKLLGEHNLGNILAATTVALACKVPLSKVRQGLRTFRGLHSRLELIVRRHKISYYNDTTATTPEAAIAAVKIFPHRQVVLIAGGADKKLSYQALARLIKSRVNKLILLPGSATDKLVVSLGKDYVYQQASSMPEAVRLAQGVAKPNQVILLSPGAASFGLFVNEWDRGEQFIKAVKKLV